MRVIPTNKPFILSLDPGYVQFANPAFELPNPLFARNSILILELGYIPARGIKNFVFSDSHIPKLVLFSRPFTSRTVLRKVKRVQRTVALPFKNTDLNRF